MQVEACAVVVAAVRDIDDEIAEAEVAELERVEVEVIVQPVCDDDLSRWPQCRRDVLKRMV